MFELTSTVWERPNYYYSPALSMAIDGALDASGLTKDKIDYFDFYSYVSPEMEGLGWILTFSPDKAAFQSCQSWHASISASL